MSRELTYFLITFISTLILSTLTVRWLIPRLKSKKMGQKILDIGPRWHKSKEGTPTMGGLSFIFASVPVTAAILFLGWRNGTECNFTLTIITYVFALLNGAIGFIDDYVKFFKKQNEGLHAWQKYLLQLIAAGAYLYAMNATGNINTELSIPFTSLTLELGAWYYIITLVLITGVVNSVNLTDGIDGLASTQTAIVGAFFAAVGVMAENFGVSVLSAVIIGGCIGFLVYNFHPAKIFMGDTGSLFLGGMIVGLAFMIDNPLIIIIAGIIYIVESGSVILQVSSYKLTGKRIFKMSPIHHHFEKCGWSENKIVGIFSLVTLAACAAAYLGVAIL